MTALTDACDTIRAWLNYGEDEYDNTLVTSFIRDAETTVSATLRVADMLQIDTAVIAADRVLLPSDWREADLIRVVDGDILKFRPRAEFYNNPDDDDNYNVGYYTISGKYLIVNSTGLDGATVELHYFQDIPALTDPANWFITRYPVIFRFAAMASAENYAREFETAAQWTNQVTALITQANDEYKASKTPQGQAVKPKRTKGFG